MNKRGLFKKMMKLAIIPLLVLGVLVMIFCYYRFRNTMYAEAENTMKNLSVLLISEYDHSFSGDYHIVKGEKDKYDLYKGETDITTCYSIVDNFKEITGMDFSLLYMDMRINTTFISENGTRLAGLYTNPETSENVLAGNEAFYKNVRILQENYLVLYTPLFNSDGSVTGMIEVARNEKSIRKDVWSAVWPIILIIIIGSGIAIWHSVKQTREITGVISKLQSYMNRVARGNLIVDMESSLTKRADELGDISKSAVAMQKSIRSFVGTDSLTGLYNRRYVQEAYSKLLERHRGTGTPFSIAIADIDFFKRINDTYGHNAGDEVLKNIASILKQAMKGHGLAARWGGEEFILIFEKEGTDDCLKVLEKTLDQIRSSTTTADGFDINVTMTFGLTAGFDADLETVVEAADTKLYYGKEHGRNQIVLNI